VLKELVIVLPDCLADHFGSLVPGIEKALNVSEFYFVETFLVLDFCLFLTYCFVDRINLLPPT
jgi:hypothetical protein